MKRDVACIDVQDVQNAFVKIRNAFEEFGLAVESFQTKYNTTFVRKEELETHNVYLDKYADLFSEYLLQQAHKAVDDEVYLKGILT